MAARFFASILLILCAVSASAQPDQSTIAGDVEQGLDAESIILNALATGKTLEEILEELAQIVGSANIEMFRSAALHVLNVATESPSQSGTNMQLVDLIIENSKQGNFPATDAGSAYIADQSNFAALADATIAAAVSGRSAESLAPVFSGILARKIALENVYNRGIAFQRNANIASFTNTPTQNGGPANQLALCFTVGSADGTEICADAAPPAGVTIARDANGQFVFDCTGLTPSVTDPAACASLVTGTSSTFVSFLETTTQ